MAGLDAVRESRELGFASDGDGEAGGDGSAGPRPRWRADGREGAGAPEAGDGAIVPYGVDPAEWLQHARTIRTPGAGPRPAPEVTGAAPGGADRPRRRGAGASAEWPSPGAASPAPAAAGGARRDLAPAPAGGPVATYTHIQGVVVLAQPRIVFRSRGAHDRSPAAAAAAAAASAIASASGPSQRQVIEVAARAAAAAVARSQEEDRGDGAGAGAGAGARRDAATTTSRGGDASTPPPGRASGSRGRSPSPASSGGGGAGARGRAPLARALERALGAAAGAGGGDWDGAAGGSDSDSDLSDEASPPATPPGAGSLPPGRRPFPTPLAARLGAMRDPPARRSGAGGGSLRGSGDAGSPGAGPGPRSRPEVSAAAAGPGPGRLAPRAPPAGGPAGVRGFGGAGGGVLTRPRPRVTDLVRAMGDGRCVLAQTSDHRSAVLRRAQELAVAAHESSGSEDSTPAGTPPGGEGSGGELDPLGSPPGVLFGLPGRGAVGRRAAAPADPMLAKVMGSRRSAGRSPASPAPAAPAAAGGASPPGGLRPVAEILVFEDEGPPKSPLVVADYPGAGGKGAVLRVSHPLPRMSPPKGPAAEQFAPARGGGAWPGGSLLSHPRPAGAAPAAPARAEPRPGAPPEVARHRVGGHPRAGALPAARRPSPHTLLGHAAPLPHRAGAGDRDPAPPGTTLPAFGTRRGGTTLRRGY